MIFILLIDIQKIRRNSIIEEYAFQIIIRLVYLIMLVLIFQNQECTRSTPSLIVSNFYLEIYIYIVRVDRNLDGPPSGAVAYPAISLMRDCPGTISFIF